ncbi:hypothetical protein EIP91_001939 [Steccherinum ochraceum]|uniref:Uncharacterized protein n=1 Tax=Steccherinum ochraceum TaxID=92696 RepID=A0A4R0RFC6_9APHY|nr:hypothetical protein EIP91_001939 [Steccherinum ochraceum]
MIGTRRRTRARESSHPAADADNEDSLPSEAEDDDQPQKKRRRVSFEETTRHTAASQQATSTRRKGKAPATKSQRPPKKPPGNQRARGNNLNADPAQVDPNSQTYECADGFAFYSTKICHQLPATARLYDPKIIRALQKDGSMKPFGRSSALARRIPDLTFVLFLCKVRKVLGRALTSVERSRRILIMEIKPLRAGKADRWTRCDHALVAARAQAKEQAQYVFHEHPDMQYLGVVVGCDSLWMFFEYKRRDLCAIGWTDPTQPIQVSRGDRFEPSDNSSVMIPSSSQSQAQPSSPPQLGASPPPSQPDMQPRLAPRAPAGSTTALNFDDLLLLDQPNAHDSSPQRDLEPRILTRAQVKLQPGTPPSPIALGKNSMKPPRFLRDIAPVPTDGSDYAYFDLHDPAGHSKQAMERIRERLKKKNADICDLAGSPNQRRARGLPLLPQTPSTRRNAAQRPPTTRERFDVTENPLLTPKTRNEAAANLVGEGPAPEAPQFVQGSSRRPL